MAIDVRDWQRRALLDPPGVRFPWVWNRNGGQLSNIRVEVNAEQVVLNYVTESEESHTEWISLVRTPCHYGGTRPWFLCPSCHQQCAKLFLRQGRFRCRVCHRLGYVSQLASSTDRPRLIAQRIRRRLGADPPSLFAPFPLKPDGMRWRTYERLRAKGQHYETLAIGHLAAWVERFKANSHGP